MLAIIFKNNLVEAQIMKREEGKSKLLQIIEWNKQGCIGMKQLENKQGFNIYPERKNDDLIDHQNYRLIIEIKSKRKSKTIVEIQQITRGEFFGPD